MNNKSIVLITAGPVSLTLVHPDLTIIPVNAADEMFAACQDWFPVVQFAKHWQ
jgi:phosphopantothenoylcysteine decarboxylase/phosphopantothenate--cysteine ligase